MRSPRVGTITSRVQSMGTETGTGKQYAWRTETHPFVRSGELPDRAFRFFKDPAHAHALCNGHVWLSTLSVCRAYEQELQGDPDEGRMHFRSGDLVVNSYDPLSVAIAARANVVVGPDCYGLQFRDNRRTTSLADAWVLCMSEHYMPDLLSSTFGQHCVEIYGVERLFVLITRRLRDRHALMEGAAGRIVYRSRVYTGLEDMPGPLGFVKDPDGFEAQQEVRFAWRFTKDETVHPILLAVPESSHHFKRIS